MNGNTRTKLNLGSQHENTSHLLKMQLKNLEVEEKNQHKCVNVNVILLLLAFASSTNSSVLCRDDGHVSESLILDALCFELLVDCRKQNKGDLKPEIH